jgi:dTDP-4-amino-4,6-dideoxygalactose transaminase
MNVPFLDLKAQNSAVKNEIMPLWESILDSAWFAGGPHVDEFESEFRQACKTEHAIAVANGTDALRLIFVAIGLNDGDEVITVPNTFIATTEAISQAGGTPVFVDMNAETYNIDVEKIEAAITPKTKGIVPVHLYGQPADMDPILAIAEKHNLWVVEDAAQAQLAEYNGKRAGSMGLAAAFSFYPGKNLGACGEAGAITTNDGELAQQIRMLRDHGQSKKYYHDVEGFNSRCDALQAAALKVKLKHLPAWTESRRAHAAQYLELLSDVEGIVLPTVLEGILPVWHLFVIQVDDREAAMEALKNADIATGLHYPVPLHLQKAYARMARAVGTFPVAEAYADRLLSLPMFPELSDEQIAYVCENVKKCTL